MTMKRKTTRIIWSICTFFVLMLIANYSQSHPSISTTSIGFTELVVIVISIVLFRRYFGSDKGKQALYVRTKSVRTKIPNEKSKDLTLYTNANSFTTSQETYGEYAGRIGEDRIAKELAKFGVGRKIIRNLIISTNGDLTEIDIVFITECGIYVIESKNYSGWIFGNLSDKYWTQTFPNATRNQFYSPILQNKGHINALKHILDQYSDVNIISVVVFSSNANLKKIPETTNDLLIFNESEIVGKLEASIDYNKKDKGVDLLTPDQIYSISSLLNQYNIESFRKRTKHINNVLKKKEKVSDTAMNKLILIITIGKVVKV